MRIVSILRCVVVACIVAGVSTVTAQGPGARTTPAAPQLQVDPFWPKPLPNNWILGQVSGVAVDKRGHVWIIQRPRSLSDRELGAQQKPAWSKCCVAAPPVIVFDQSGNVVRAWGGPGTGYEWPESEHGVFVDDTDSVWIAGNGNKDSQILKFTLEGKFVLQIGRSGQSKGSNDTANLGSPADINVDIAGARGLRRRRLPQPARDCVRLRDRRLQAALGSVRKTTERCGDAARTIRREPPSTQFGQPVHCVRLAKDGLLYVCDRTNDRFQIFRKDGTFVSEAFFEKDTRLNGSVSELAFSPDREQSLIYMVDGVNNEMRIVDRATNAVLGRVGRPGRFAGQFHVVHNVAVDAQGNVYTTEVNTGQRVQKFRRLD